MRCSRADTDDVRNLGGWLTTVVARVCLDMLRHAASRREEPSRRTVPDPRGPPASSPRRRPCWPTRSGWPCSSCSTTLAPAERLAFVLHDMFAVPFDEIGAIVGRSPEAARQLASRARAGSGARRDAAVDVARQREVVDAFLAASRDGDFAGLLAVLDPDVVFRSDESPRRAVACRSRCAGRRAVAEQYVGRAVLARSALVDGRVGVVVAPLGHLVVVLAVTIEAGRIVAIDAVADPDHLGRSTSPSADPPISSVSAGSTVVSRSS